MSFSETGLRRSGPTTARASLFLCVCVCVVGRKSSFLSTSASWGSHRGLRLGRSVKRLYKSTKMVGGALAHFASILFDPLYLRKRRPCKSEERSRRRLPQHASHPLAGPGVPPVPFPARKADSPHEPRLHLRLLLGGGEGGEGEADENISFILGSMFSCEGVEGVLLRWDPRVGARMWGRGERLSAPSSPRQKRLLV